MRNLAERAFDKIWNVVDDIRDGVGNCLGRDRSARASEWMKRNRMNLVVSGTVALALMALVPRDKTGDRATSESWSKLPPPTEHPGFYVTRPQPKSSGWENIFRKSSLENHLEIDLQQDSNQSL